MNGLKTNKKVDIMLVSTFLSSLLYSSTYPYIHKEIISKISSNAIAFNQMIICLSIIFFGSMWNKYSKKFFNIFPIFCIIETLSLIILAFYTTFTKNVFVYYIADTLIFALLSQNICCGAVKLRAIRYQTETAREQFDNNDNSASAIATIIGSIISIALKLNFEAMLWLAVIGNIMDNVFCGIIYIKSKNKSR